MYILFIRYMNSWCISYCESRIYGKSILGCLPDARIHMWFSLTFNTAKLCSIGKFYVPIFRREGLNQKLLFWLKCKKTTLSSELTFMSCKVWIFRKHRFHIKEHKTYNFVTSAKTFSCPMGNLGHKTSKKNSQINWLSFVS